MILEWLISLVGSRIIKFTISSAAARRSEMNPRGSRLSTFLAELHRGLRSCSTYHDIADRAAPLDHGPVSHQSATCILALPEPQLNPHAVSDLSPISVASKTLAGSTYCPVGQVFMLTKEVMNSGRYLCLRLEAKISDRKHMLTCFKIRLFFGQLTDDCHAYQYRSSRITCTHDQIALAPFPIRRLPIRVTNLVRSRSSFLIN